MSTTVSRRMLPRRSSMTRRILRHYRLASPAARYWGPEWYPAARMTCHAMARAYGLRPETVAGILAALSPRIRWETNLSAAWALLAGERIRGPYKRSIRRAEHILVTDDAGCDPLDMLSGPKVRAFYAAIMDIPGPAVIDSWALRAATGLAWADAPSPTAYDPVARAYASAARILGQPVHAVQATVWLAVRGEVRIIGGMPA